jgi:hypothetical protein
MRSEFTVIAFGTLETVCADNDPRGIAIAVTEAGS